MKKCDLFVLRPSDQKFEAFSVLDNFKTLFFFCVGKIQSPFSRQDGLNRAYHKLDLKVRLPPVRYTVHVALFCNS